MDREALLAMTFTVDFATRFPSLNLALPMKALHHQEFIGRSRGDLMTKIHVTCDALSNSTSFHLSRIKPYYLEDSNVLLETILDQIKAF